MLIEGQRSLINTLLSVRQLLEYPVGEIPYAPEYRVRTQLDLHGEGPVTYECINKGSTHTSLLKDEGQEEDMQGCTLKK